MDLQRKPYRFCTVVQIFKILSPCFGFFLLSIQPVAVQSAPQKPAIIRDTDVADGKETEDVPAAKEPNPMLCEQNINIGNFYYKKKNYEAAIRRYLDAIEYQPDSVRAYDALTRAYEKSDQPAKAIAAYRQFLDKQPDSPKSSEFRMRLAKLEKGSTK
jgi:tetratricopeptide (TPR) repeat protein